MFILIAGIILFFFSGDDRRGGSWERQQAPPPIDRLVIDISGVHSPKTKVYVNSLWIECWVNFYALLSSADFFFKIIFFENFF